MKTKKTLALLLAALLLTGSIGTTFADRDGDDDRGERNEHRYERDDNRENGENEKKEHKNGNGERYEDDRDGDDDRGNKNGKDNDDMNGDDNADNNGDTMKNKKKNKELRAQYKAKFKAKLGNRLDNIDKTKLETIVIIIDTKVLELEADTTMTDERKEKLTIIYGAIRDLITDKIAKMSGNDILDGLLQ